MTWAAKNPGKTKIKQRRNNATRRARKLDQFVETVDSQIVFEMHGGMCGICKEFIDLNVENGFHVDHIKPLSKGGLHSYINVQPAHIICNLRKGNQAGCLPNSQLPKTMTS